MNYSELIVRGVEEGKYSQRLYKYRKIDEKTLCSLRSSSFWFSKPSSFNDPLDCRLSLKANQSIADYKKLLIRSGLPSQIVKSKVNEAKTNQRIISNAISASRDRVLNRRGILSLSRNKDNILMWSHYAGDHTGLVIEFDILEDVDFFSIPLNVNYQKTYKPLDYFSDPEGAAIKTVSIKSDLWEYEQEVRIFKEKFGLVSIKPAAIRRIIFGCNSNKHEIDLVKDACSNSNLKHLRYSKASVSYGKFSLNFHEL